MHASGVQARAQRAVAWQAPARASRSHAVTASKLGLGESLWDRDTGVPLRMWGAGSAAPGSVGSATTAARTARELLTAHLAVLAPGSRAGDFVLVGNDLGGGVRSVGFQQTFAGRPVIGGQLSFRFKRDRLIAVGSEAFPRISVALTDRPITAATAQDRARAWILAEAAATASAGAVEGPFILPVVAGREIRYHEVLRVTVEASEPLGRFAVHVDAATGDPVAREQLLHFASGTVAFQVPQRGPQGPRVDVPATLLDVVVNGVAGATDTAGVVGFADGNTAEVIAGVVGAQVAVLNEDGPPASKNLSLPPGGIALWSDPSELIDAQLSAYAHVGIAKQRVRSIAPDFAFLDEQLQVMVNKATGDCIAYAEGDSLHFYQSGDCENTAQIADIVYHEFGHSVHVHGIIEGVGAFEAALSEGIADYLSASITGDASIAPSFYFESPADPLRELDPPGDEWRWPDDLTGLIHDDGRIIGGTLWDLRTALIEKLGPAGGAQADRIWFESIRRAVDIPSMYPEALVADDDDGNLANGTPNGCEINLAFKAHGLLGAADVRGSVALLPATPNGTPVRLELLIGSQACIDDLAATGAKLVIKTSGLTLDMLPEPGGFGAILPNFPDGTVAEYQIVVDLSDGSSVSFPQNPADPWYQKYFGPVTNLFCTSFEGPPENEGWTLDGEWAWGSATGQSGDPGAPFSGSGMVGTNLAGAYAPDTVSSMTSPSIDTAGFKTVRLQYRRWLDVDSAFNDHAKIAVNGKKVWKNRETPEDGPFVPVVHRDSEWRFHDVDISGPGAGGQIQLEFSLTSDDIDELGGWNVDDFCVVGTDQGKPAPLCGDGVVDAGEACDTGPANSDTTPNACRTDCVVAHCGDSVLDSGEQCDDGDALGGDGCSEACMLEGPGSTSDVPTTSAGETGSEGSDTDSESGSSGPDTAGLDSDSGCGCDGGEPRGLPALGLGLLALAGLRRRRR